MKSIGFATQFYTLWDVDTQPNYVTDVYGNHHLTGYSTHYGYIQNISTCLEKVKGLYPGISIDENLRGKTRSWTSESAVDLCPNIIKFGKYAGRDLNDLVASDFNYVLWLSGQSGQSANYAAGLPAIVKHRANIEAAENARIKANTDAFNAILYAGVIECIMPSSLREIGEKYAVADVMTDGISLRMEFPDYQLQEYNGFQYALPVVGGKAKRIKGKAIVARIERSENDLYAVRVLDLKILKTTI